MIEAETQGLPLNAFIMGDYRIPYGYSPVLTTTQSLIDYKRETYKSFLKASRKGFLYARQQPQEAVDILEPFVPKDQSDTMDLLKCQVATAAYYGNEKSWGIMEPDRVSDFLDWLKQHELEKQTHGLQQAFNNTLLGEIQE